MSKLTREGGESVAGTKTRNRKKRRGERRMKVTRETPLGRSLAYKISSGSCRSGGGKRSAGQKRGGDAKNKKTVVGWLFGLRGGRKEGKSRNAGDLKTKRGGGKGETGGYWRKKGESERPNSINVVKA